MTVLTSISATAAAPRTTWRNLKPVGAAWWEVIRDRGGVNRKYVSFVELFPEDFVLFDSLGLLAQLPDYPPPVRPSERDWIEIAFESASGGRERLKLPTEAVDCFWRAAARPFLAQLGSVPASEQPRAQALANLLCTFTGEGPQDWPPLGECLDSQPGGQLRQARHQGWYWLAAASGDRESEGYPRWLYD
jgi:hypothetical protein